MIEKIEDEVGVFQISDSFGLISCGNERGSERVVGGRGTFN